MPALRSNWLSDQREAGNQIPAKTSAVQGETTCLAYCRHRMKVNWGRRVRKRKGYCNFAFSWRKGWIFSPIFSLYCAHRWLYYCSFKTFRSQVLPLLTSKWWLNKCSFILFEILGRALVCTVPRPSENCFPSKSIKFRWHVPARLHNALNLLF